jgi:hypothetical protein
LLLPGLFSKVEIVVGGGVLIASTDAGISESNKFHGIYEKTTNMVVLGFLLI